MPQREFSIFKGIANHHRQLKDEKWSSWIGTSDDRPLRGILALKYKSPPHTNRPIKKYHKIREKTLTDETVREWLQQPVPDAGSLQAQLKVLICHEEDIKDGDGGEAHKHYHMAAKSFDAAEEYLRLCIQTLPNLTNKWGIQTSEFTTMEERMGKDSKEMTCLEITMKNPSIPEIPPYGVSLTYNFSTRHTTAFIRGANAVMRDLKDPDAPPGTKDNFKYPALKLHYKLFSELETTMPLWGHPLLVPVILLKAELDGIRNFARDRLDSGSLNIQATMSMDYEDQAAVLGGENANRRGRQDRVDFTNGLNRLLCSAYSVRRALGVARQAAGFLLGVLEEMDPDRLLLLPGEDKVSRRENQQIKDTIRALDRGAAGFEAGIDSIISSLDVQLNILSVVASQLDNKRSAEMSAQAGLDSVAMKTLALVTAIFLPATFIATLFSMSMFDWQGPTVVSSNFWVFWVVVVPLSTAILGSWWYFWYLSRYAYADKYEDADPSSEHAALWKMFQKLRRLKKESKQNKSRKGEEVQRVGYGVENGREDTADETGFRLGDILSRTVKRGPRRSDEYRMELGASV